MEDKLQEKKITTQKTNALLASFQFFFSNGLVSCLSCPETQAGWTRAQQVLVLGLIEQNGVGWGYQAPSFCAPFTVRPPEHCCLSWTEHCCLSSVQSGPGFHCEKEQAGAHSHSHEHYSKGDTAQGATLVYLLQTGKGFGEMVIREGREGN